MGEDSKGDGGAVQRDVLRFAESHQFELDDGFGPRAQPLRTLGRARPGLFVSYLSFQWFMRKKHDVIVKPVSDDHFVMSTKLAPQMTTSSFDCWSDGYEAKDCCDEQQFGLGGNPKC